MTVLRKFTGRDLGCIKKKMTGTCILGDACLYLNGREKVYLKLYGRLR